MAHRPTFPATASPRIAHKGYAGCGSSVSPHASKGTTNTVLREVPVRRHAVRGFSLKGLRVHDRSLAFFACLSLTTILNKVAKQ